MFQYNQKKLNEYSEMLWFIYLFILVLLPNNIHATFVERFVFPIWKK